MDIFIIEETFEDFYQYASTLNQPKTVITIMKLECVFTLIPFSYLLQRPKR